MAIATHARRRNCCRLCCAVIAALCVCLFARADSGPDVIVADLHEVVRYNTGAEDPPGITAYGIGTVACNLGDEPADWIAAKPEHPAIIQNMYRLKEGRLEQIGQSWIKHGFCAISWTLECGHPLGCSPTGCESLGVGCSDPYSATLNGQQSNMSPRWEVDASTGIFPFPPMSVDQWPNTPIGGGSWPASMFRLQVHNEDLDPALNPGAIYFAEGHYVLADDTAAGNGTNNASYRQLLPAFVGTIYPFTFAGAPSCERQSPAIVAWSDYDAAVVYPAIVDVLDDGRFYIASKVTPLAESWWRYEYAVYNMNSDRSAGEVRIAVHPETHVRAFGFHDVDYHSGEPYDGTDWAVDVTSGQVRWFTETYATNEYANALRWGTMYNFYMEANVPDVPDSTFTVGLFKPSGTGPADFSVQIRGPTIDPPDCDTNGTPDYLDIQSDPGLDCNSDGLLDVCQADCDGDMQPDVCQIVADPLLDCNGNERIDACEIDVNSPAPGGPYYCTADCDPDCNVNGVPDACDIASGSDPDCNTNGVPDSCDIAGDAAIDCNTNGVPDSCDIAGGFEPDCNSNDVPDSCDIATGYDPDCNTNGVPDSCDLASALEPDCNLNGVPDSCDVDCNSNGQPDDCEYPDCSDFLPGDMDCNGVVDTADIPLFVDYVLDGTVISCQADVPPRDGLVNGLDITGFVNALLGS